MKSGITYLETKTFVNEDEKTCAARIVFEIDKTKIANFEKLMTFEKINRFVSKYLKPKEVVGISKVNVNSNDVFDAEVGKHIAISKAQEKAMRYASKFYTKLNKLIFEEISQPIIYLYRGAAINAYKEFIHISELGQTTINTDIYKYFDNLISKITKF